jgi:hypothetical protein
MKNLFILPLVLGFFILSCTTANNPTYQITTTVSPSEGGTISPSSGTYSEGEVVSLTANPSTGWRFIRWEGDWSGAVNPVNIGMNRNYNIVGIFEKRNYPLTINIDGDGEVEERVIQQKTTEYPYQTIVELNPVPYNGWRFLEWSGDLSGNEVPKQITVDGEKTVTAKFERKNYPLTINIVGEGTVKETVLPQRTTQYPFETAVILESIPSEGWEFVSWSGDLNGEENPKLIVVDGDKMVTATFKSLRDTETEVVDVTNPITGRTWMDRNLGASRAATSPTDSEAYGDLYQWGRGADGHQKRNSSTTSTLSTSDTPPHGSFILAPNSPWDWRNPKNDNLWQGVNGINNPCPLGYRIPTIAEWKAELQSWSSNNASGAFNSPLKLPMAGYRSYTNGVLNDADIFGVYWSSSILGLFPEDFSFRNDSAITGNTVRSLAFSLRCIKN